MRFRFGGTVVEFGRGQLTKVIVLSGILCVTLLFLTNRGLLRQTESLEDTDLATPISILLPDDEEVEMMERGAQPSGLHHRVPKNQKQDDPSHMRKKGLQGGGGGGRDPDAALKPVQMAMKGVSRKKRPALAEALRGVVGLDNRPPDNHYNINVTLSDVTSLDRPLPDTRPPVCQNLTYNLNVLSKVSVIIPFFNEAPTMILRTVHSVLNRSPDQLLEEIILVDDMSFDAPLKDPLEKYVRLLPKVRIMRRNKRSGLIVSRMDGARSAKAPVLLFLDAHSEVGYGWLEPLLEELRRDPKQVIQPFIDGVDSKTLEFTAPTTYYKGAFSWDLRYTWLRLSPYEEERAKLQGQPFVSPTLVGCAIAVMKDYFFEMGAFDEGLYVWGGENLELAFRMWMCGGKTVTVTCSRAGHVFKQSPNKFDGTIGTKEQTVQKNLIRVADVWMDRFRKFFYATTLPYDFKRLKVNEAERKSLKERSELRQRLKCHNFDWYLYNVIPEMMDLPPTSSRYFGEIMNLHTKACWEVTEDYYIGMTYFCFEHKVIPKNNFALTSDGLLRYRDKCVKIVPPKPYLTLAECPQNDLESFGVWEMVSRGVVWGGLKVRQRNADNVMVYWCLVQVTNAMPEHKNEQMPQLGDCKDSDLFQIWAFTYAVDFSLESQFVQERV